MGEVGVGDIERQRVADDRAAEGDLAHFETGATPWGADVEELRGGETGGGDVEAGGAEMICRWSDLVRRNVPMDVAPSVTRLVYLLITGLWLFAVSYGVAVLLMAS